jgi:hypothetical protein
MEQGKGRRRQEAAERQKWACADGGPIRRFAQADMIVPPQLLSRRAIARHAKILRGARPPNVCTFLSFYGTIWIRV